MSYFRLMILQYSITEYLDIQNRALFKQLKKHTALLKLKSLYYAHIYILIDAFEFVALCDFKQDTKGKLQQLYK